MMQLSAPQTSVRRVGKLAFVIDPFNKTNDANRTNNVLFATINLQSFARGESDINIPGKQNDAADPQREVVKQKREDRSVIRVVIT